MRLPGAPATEALGIQIDHDLVRLAHLRWEEGRVVLVGLHQTRLVQRLDVEEEGDEEAGPPQGAGDILGLAQDSPLDLTESVEASHGEGEAAPESNSDVLYALLNQFDLKKSNLALSMAETGVFFTDFTHDFGLKGTKLRNRLMEETANEGGADLPLPLRDRHVYFPVAEGRLLSILHEDRLAILDLLDELEPFVGLVQIKSIEPLEVTLMNLVRLDRPLDEQVTAIIYVAHDFSRVIFMQNGEYLRFSRPIHEGVESPQTLLTIYSRILFEQDEQQLPDISQVLLAGECRELDAQPFFAEQFADASVGYLGQDSLDVSAVDEEAQTQVSDYAVPIGLAWRTLRPKAATFYPVNFLPRARRRQQNPLELAWHGLTLLAVLLTSVLFLGFKLQDQTEVMDQLKLEISLAEQQIAEHSSYLQLLDDLYAQIGDYERNFALIDTLAKRRVLSSHRLQKIATAFRSTGDVWLERYSTSEGNLEAQVGSDAVAPQDLFMYGKASKRERIAQIAENLGDGYIQSIVRSEVRGQRIYEFDLKVPVQQRSPEP